MARARNSALVFLWSGSAWASCVESCECVCMWVCFLTRALLLCFTAFPNVFTLNLKHAKTGVKWFRSFAVSLFECRKWRIISLMSSTLRIKATEQDCWRSKTVPPVVHTVIFLSFAFYFVCIITQLSYCLSLLFLISDQHQWLCCHSRANQWVDISWQNASKVWHDRSPAGGSGHERWGRQSLFSPGLHPRGLAPICRAHQQGFPRGWRSQPHPHDSNHLVRHREPGTPRPRRHQDTVPPEQGQFPVLF